MADHVVTAAFKAASGIVAVQLNWTLEEHQLACSDFLAGKFTRLCDMSGWKQLK